MTEEQKAIAEMILSTLERQKFTDFYNTGDFDRYIRGEEDAKSRDEILEEIVKLFRIS